MIQVIQRFKPLPYGIMTTGFYMNSRVGIESSDQISEQIYLSGFACFIVISRAVSK